MNHRSKSESSVEPLRERVKRATHDAIVDAAEAEFARRGFAGARMEDIAARAGVSVGTLYNYFEDRRALLDAVLGAAADDFTRRLHEEVPPADSAPFADRLRRFVEASLAEIDAHFRAYAILVEEEVATARTAAGGGRCKRLMLHKAYEVAEALVADGVASAALRPEDAGVYAALLVGMLRGVFMRRLRSGGDEPLTTCGPAIVRLFIEGARSHA